MKIASFAAANGESYGVVTDVGVIDIGHKLKFRLPTLRAAIAESSLAEIAQLSKGRSADFKFDEVKWLPPISNPDKIICIGLNYMAHAAESGAKVPEKPSLFIRLTNTLVPHQGAMIRPKLSSDMDFEGELAVVIGKGGRHVAKADAFKHVAGYACFNDGSVRDFQFKHSLAVGKNFFATGGFGPWIVTTDEIPDPSRLTLRTRLNGTEVQHGTTDDLIFSVPWIVSYISDFTELVPGDVIATGTPQGVGFARKPPLWMKPGDVIEVDISGIGTLRNCIVDER